MAALGRMQHQDRQDPLPPPPQPSVLEKIALPVIAGCLLAIVGTSVQMYTGIEVIKAGMSALSKSDQEQDKKIVDLERDVNRTRIEIGIIRELERRKTQ